MRTKVIKYSDNEIKFFNENLMTAILKRLIQRKTDKFHSQTLDIAMNEIMIIVKCFFIHEKRSHFSLLAATSHRSRDRGDCLGDYLTTAFQLPIHG